MNWLYNFLPENFVHALGWTVLHSLWQGIVIAAIMALLLSQIQNRSAAVRYRIAYGSLVAMFVAAIATFAYYSRKAAPSSDELQILAEILRGGKTTAVALSEGDYWSKTTLFLQKNLPFIALVWLMGVAFFTLRLISGLLYVEQLRTRQIAPLSSTWQARLHAFKNQLGIKQAVDLAESALVTVPMVIGWLKPMILMPIGAINQLNAAQVEAILAHELAHIAGRDYLLNILQSVIEILFYYHPAAWWLSANIRAERENRCDDVAVQLCGNSLTYAKALLSIQEMQVSHVRSYGLAMTFAGQRKNLLLKRIKRILNQPHNRSNIMEKFIATGLLLAVVSALSFGSTQFSEKKAQNSDADTPSVSAAILTDSMPKKGKVWVKREDDNGKQVEVQVENGVIQDLKIDGKTLNKDEYDNYRDLVEEVVSLPLPPTPPTPPAYPSFPSPPVPPTPPAYPNVPTPPTPPTPPRFFSWDSDYSSIRSSTDEEGNRILKLKKPDGTTSVIKITPSKEVFIDGKKAEDNKDLKLNFGNSNGRFHFNLKELDALKDLNFNYNFDWDGDKKGKKFNFWSNGDGFSYRFNDSVFSNGKNTIVIDGDSVFVMNKDSSIVRRYKKRNAYGYSYGDSPEQEEKARKMAEEWRERSEEWRKESEKSREIAKRHREESEKLRREWQAKEREHQARMREEMAREREKMGEVREKMAKEREKMAEKRAELAREREERNKQLRADLEADGLIEKGAKRINFDLTEKELEVNGKKVSPELHRKYLAKYCKNCGGSSFRWQYNDED